MELGQVCLRRGEEKKLLAGQQWIFDNEADWADERCHDGEVVEVLDSRLRFVGKGFFNSKSKIVVRMLTRDRFEAIDRAFLRAVCARHGITAGSSASPMPAASSSARRTVCRG